MSCDNNNCCCTSALLPVFLITLVVMGFLAFQTYMLSSDRAALATAYTQQDKPIEQVEKLKTSVNALAVGTLTLAKQGNKNAEGIIDQLKKAGVNIQDQPPAPAGAAPAAPAK